MARRAVIVAALGLALASAETAHAVTNTGTVYRTVTVAPDSIQTVTVTCPPGFVAVAGGMVVGKLLFTGGSGPLLSVTRSTAGNAFNFRVGVPVTGSAQTLTLSVRCVRRGFRPAVPALGIKVVKATGAGILLAPGTTKNATVRCPTGSAPAGAGYDVQPADAPRAAPRGAASQHYPLGLSTRLTRSMPVPGGWQFTIRDSGTRPADVKVEVECLRKVYRARLHDRRLAVRTETVLRQTTHNNIEGRSHTTVHARCDLGQPLGSGFAFDPGLDLIPLTGPGRGRNQFLFEVLNGEMRKVAFVEYELCRVERSYVG